MLFAPEDLALVRGEPAGRRRFLDELLVQRTPRFAGVRADYDRVLQAAQRAAEVGAAARGVAAVSDCAPSTSGTAQLSTAGAELLAGRHRAGRRRCAAASPRRTRRSPSARSAGPAAIDVPVVARRRRSPADRRPRPCSPPPAGALAGVRGQELDRGITLVGPHRDDLLLELDGLPAKGYASHGESWSFALALRLASRYELLRAGSAAGTRC